MKLGIIADKMGFTEITPVDCGQEIMGAYCCDLLSWVMGRASPGQIWVTIMTNINTVAVASLTETVILLAEGVKPDEGVADKAASQNVGIYSTEMDAYTVCARLGKLFETNE